LVRVGAIAMGLGIGGCEPHFHARKVSAHSADLPGFGGFDL